MKKQPWKTKPTQLRPQNELCIQFYNVPQYLLFLWKWDLKFQEMSDKETGIHALATLNFTTGDNRVYNIFIVVLLQYLM